MSFSTISVSGAKENLIVRIPASDDPAGSANSTIEPELTGNLGASVANKIHWIEVDWRNNPIENGMFRIYVESSLPTVGAAKAYVFVRGLRGRILTYHFPAPIVCTLNNHLYGATVKGLGGTGGSASPSGKVIVRLGLTIGS